MMELEEHLLNGTQENHYMQQEHERQVNKQETNQAPVVLYLFIAPNAQMTEKKLELQDQQKNGLITTTSTTTSRVNTSANQQELSPVTMKMKLLRTTINYQEGHIPITDPSITKLINGVRYEILSTVPLYDVKVSYQTIRTKRNGVFQGDDNGKASIEPVDTQRRKVRLHLQHFSSQNTNRAYSFQFLDVNGSIVLQTQYFMIYSIHTIMNNPNGFPWADNLNKHSNMKQSAKKRATTGKRKRKTTSSSNKKRKEE
jgi:hypothetical protein